MNILNKSLLKKLALGLAFLIVTNCSGGTNKGVEVGSPDLPPVTSTNNKNKALVLTPEDQEKYPFSVQVVFLNDQFASVSKINTPENISNLVRALGVNVDTIDSVVVEYSEANGVITVSGTFSDGSQFSVTVETDDDNNFANANLELDNENVGVEAEALASDQDANEADSADALANGRVQLVNQNFDEALDTYCNAFRLNGENSELAFGCFFTKLIELSGSDEYQSIMAAFDESQVPLIDRLLADGGLLDLRDRIETPSDRFPAFNYYDFDLPFSQKINQYDGGEFLVKSDKVERLVQVLLEQNITLDELKTRINNFKPYFQEFEILLSVVAADEDFSFNMPGLAFRLNSNFVVTHNDILFTLSGVQGTLVGFDIMMAYNQGLEIENIMTEDEFVADLLQVNPEILVADLNGSGELINAGNGQLVEVDEVAFLTLVNGDLITRNRDRFLSSLVLSSVAMTNLLNGEVSTMTENVVTDYDLQEGINVINDLIISMVTDQLTPIQKPIASGHFGVEFERISVNLQAFFDNPPSASNIDIAVGDPFVISNNGKAQAVKAYFDVFLDGIVTFE
jgi:hypothetical protein